MTNIIELQFRVTCKIIKRQQTTRNIVYTHFVSIEVKQRVELYIYSPSGPSWHVVEWTFVIVTETFVPQFHVSVEHNFCIYQSFIILVKMRFTFFYQKKKQADWLVVLTKHWIIHKCTHRRNMGLINNTSEQMMIFKMGYQISFY